MMLLMFYAADITPWLRYFARARQMLIAIFRCLALRHASWRCWRVFSLTSLRYDAAMTWLPLPPPMPYAIESVAAAAAACRH